MTLLLQAEVWPLLRAACAWVGARGEWTARGFEVRNAMNPDEGKGHVDNANFFNLAAMMVLQAL